MSGIAGIINFYQGRVEEELLKKITDPLCRSPQETVGFSLTKSIGFSHSHLLPQFGYHNSQETEVKEPYTDRDTGHSITFMGTLYNYYELRTKLEGLGLVFHVANPKKTISPAFSELLLLAYRSWGIEKTAKKLEGSFAFALWDHGGEVVHLVRDRFGIKPLYYGISEEGDQLFFSSHLKSLLVSKKISTQLNARALHFLFTLHGIVPAPQTIFTNISQVKPAHIITIDSFGEQKETKYWCLQEYAKEKEQKNSGLRKMVSEMEWQESIDFALAQAVKKRMAWSYKPTGLLLSGGLDSSLLTYYAAKEAIEKGQSLKTFSIGFADTVEVGDEFRASRKIARDFATEHFEYAITNQTLLERLPEAIHDMSEPFFSQDAVGFFLLGERAIQHTDVVLNGQGADELFAGYFWYPLMAKSDEVIPHNRFSHFYFDRSHPEWCELIHQHHHGGDITGEFLADTFSTLENKDFLTDVLQLELSTLMTGDPLKRIERMLGAHGLTTRMPFLDHKLIKLALTVPTSYKLAREGKGILKNIAEKKIPQTMIDQPKGYFPVPALKFLQGDFLAMIKEALLSQKAKERGLFNRDTLEALLQNPTSKENFTKIEGATLWHCALLELWLEDQGL